MYLVKIYKICNEAKQSDKLVCQSLWVEIMSSTLSWRQCRILVIIFFEKGFILKKEYYYPEY